MNKRSGANSATYTTPIATITNNGSLYTVKVTNPAGVVTSAAATLTVNNSIPVASGLACSPLAPAYKVTVSIIPTFTGGSATIGSSGVGSSDVIN